MSNRKKKELLKKQQEKKKKIIFAIIAAIVVVAIIAVSVPLIKNLSEKDKNEEAQTEIEPPSVIGNITNMEVAKILSLEISNGEISYVLKNDVGFELEGYASDMLDTTELAANLLYVSRQVPYTGEIRDIKSLADYGLENTDKTVALNCADGSRIKLLFGKQASDFEYYAMVENGDVVYTVLKETYDLLMLHPKEYRDKYVCTIDPNSIESLSIVKNGEKEVSVVKDSNFVPTNEYQTVSYLVDYPYNNVVASLGTLQYIFETLGEINAESVVEENPTDLSVYGLSDDKATVMTIKDGYETTVLRMGDKKDDNVYLMCNDSKVVYLVAPGFYDLVEGYKAANYVEDFVAIYNIDSVESVEIAKDNEKRTMERLVDSEGIESFRLNGKPIADKEFRKKYQYVIGITLEDIIEEEPAGDVYMTVKYSFRDSTSVTYTYYDYDEKYCVVKAKNGLSCLALKKEIDDAFANATKEK